MSFLNCVRLQPLFRQNVFWTLNFMLFDPSFALNLTDDMGNFDTPIRNNTEGPHPIITCGSLSLVDIAGPLSTISR
jgi:hypothetical protein